jgi:ABC-type dipeptide/oligopeptide/nickel transport system permease subunit
VNSQLQKQLRLFRQHKSGMLGLGIVVFFLVLAAVAPWVAPFDPSAQDPDLKFLPPIWNEQGRWPYVLGTDILGRDLFSRLLHGAQLSLMIGIISVAVGASIGIPLGLVSGYVGGKTDTIIMRLIDVLLAFPSVLLAVCIVAILGPSLENAMIAIGLVAVPTYARVVRASVLSEKERDYVSADVALGRRSSHILFLGILPNIMSPILVLATLGFAGAVLEAAGLSFIGLGAQPPTPEWGALLFEGKNALYQAPWLIWYPGIAILFTVMGFNLFGDALRDIFDPKSKLR